MTCRPCAAALHDPLHAEYRSQECPGCAVRRLAHMPAAQRQAMYLRLQHLLDGDAVKRILEDVKLEQARIRQLRDRHARKERA